MALVSEAGLPTLAAYFLLPMDHAIAASRRVNRSSVRRAATMRLRYLGAASPCAHRTPKILLPTGWIAPESTPLVCTRAGGCDGSACWLFCGEFAPRSGGPSSAPRLGPVLGSMRR